MVCTAHREGEEGGLVQIMLTQIGSWLPMRAKQAAPCLVWAANSRFGFTWFKLGELLIHRVMVVFKCLLVRHKRFLRSNHLYFASLHNNNPNFMFTLTLEENGNFQRCEKRFLIVRGKTRMSNKILPKLFMHTYLVCGKVFRLQGGSA